MLADYFLQNGWTDLAKFFFVSSVLVTQMVLGQKKSGSGFSGSGIRYPEKPKIKTGSPRRSGDRALMHESTFVKNKK